MGPQRRAVRCDVGRKSLPTIEVALALEVAMVKLQWFVAAASHAIMPHILSSTRNRTLRCERWRSERSFRTLCRFERHQAASYGAAAVPSKTTCRQTLTTPDGPERHRRFYLAVDPRPCRRSQTLVGALGPAVVMSGVANSGRKSGHGNIDANDPKLPRCPTSLLRCLTSA